MFIDLLSPLASRRLLLLHKLLQVADIIIKLGNIMFNNIYQFLNLRRLVIEQRLPLGH